MSLLITLVAAIEVMLYGFFGQIIDWLAQADKAAFLEREGDTMIFIAAVVLLALPLLTLQLNLVTHQTILGMAHDGMNTIARVQTVTDIAEAFDSRVLENN